MSERTSLSAQARWSRRTGLGARLRNARQAARLSPAELSSGLTSLAYLSRLEADERRPSPALLVQLANRLGADADELALPESRVAAGLAAELAHADLLLGTGQIEDATWVSADLVEVASGAGEREIAHAARIVNAYAGAAAGQPRTALRTVRPLARGPMATLALVAQARFQLELGQHHRAIEAGQRAADLMTANRSVSLAEAADVAVTLCEAYRATGRTSAAAQVARLTLQHLPTRAQLASAEPTGQPTGMLSYRSLGHGVLAIERTVAELQMTKLCADVDLLGSYGPPSSNRAALSAVRTGQEAAS